MEHIAGNLQKIDQNIKINSADPVALHGFTQVPNFILKNPDISIGAKTVYALFLSYAWHNNMCFPGQDTLAKGHRHEHWQRQRFHQGAGGPPASSRSPAAARARRISTP